MLEQYIGAKFIKAEPCDAWKDSGDHKTGDAGYKVVYPDGYESWSPKEVFENAYLRIPPNASLRSQAPSISPRTVDNFIASTTVQTIGEKTTVVRAVLCNGFEIVEASSCVSVENYDEALGEAVCMEKIKDKVCLLLGFLLQTAVTGVNGVKPKEA